MKKVAYLFASILTLLLVGCQPAVEKTVEPVTKPAEKSVSSFDATTLIPTTAISSETYSLDFDNDGVEEKAIHYVNRDDVDGEGLFSKQDHINIYQLRGNNWEINYEYVFPVINKDTGMRDWRSNVKEEPDSRIKSVSVTDIANDGKKELFINIEDKPFGDWRFDSYVVIGDQAGKSTTLDFPRGFDGKTPGMRMEDTGEPYSRLLSAIVTAGKIIERWGGLCEGGTNPCYTFEFEISFNPVDGSWKISKAQNIQQVPEEWNAYQKEYGGEWTGTLPF